MSSLEEQLLKQRAEDAERKAYQAINGARNVLVAVKIELEEGDVDEALRLIGEALGEDDSPSPQMPLLDDEG